MSLTRRGLIGLGLASMAAACSSTIIAPAPGLASNPAKLTQASILSAINGTRAHFGKPPLTYNGKLENAARFQANLMASKDQLSHDLGFNLRRRVTDAGYEGAVGEDVAGGQHSLDQAIQGWLNSPPHRDTLLSTKFVEFGLAAAQVGAGRKSRYGTYWSFIAGGPFEAWR